MIVGSTHDAIKMSIRIDNPPPGLLRAVEHTRVSILTTLELLERSKIRRVSAMAPIMYRSLLDKKVELAVDPDTHFGFMVEELQGTMVRRGTVSVCPCFGEHLDDHPVKHLRILVAFMSGVCDFVNGQLLGHESKTKTRQVAAEAELVLWMGLNPQFGFKPDDRDRLLVSDYPQGVETPAVKGLMYELSPPPVGN